MLGGETWSWVAHQKQVQVPSLAAFEYMLCQMLVKPVIPPDICHSLIVRMLCQFTSLLWDATTSGSSKP